MEEWKVVGVVIEGQPIDLEGLNPWKLEWRETQEDAIELPHPSYPTQRHRMRVYKMEGAGKIVKFAAGELSANVWGFYLPS
jgi:hypothetical protein